MTRIKYKAKPVWHETGLLDKSSGRFYCVAETPANLLLRMKGTRQVLSIPWSVVFIKAAWMEAARLKLAKKTAKAEARKGKVS